MNHTPLPPTQPHRSPLKQRRYLLIGLLLLGVVYGYAELFPQRAPRLRRILQHPLTLGLLVIAVIGWWIARNLFSW